MKTLASYLRSRRAALVFLLLFTAVFTCVFYLFGMDMGAVLYAMLICVFVFLLWLAYDFSCFSRTCRRLSEIEANLGSYTHSFPDTEDELARRYLKIITHLYETIEAQKLALTAAHGEQLDYYTMWLHQIKTPISAMRLALDSGHTDTAIFRQELFHIERYVEMALQYVKLRDLSTDLVVREYPLGDIVRGSLKKFAVLFACSGLTLSISELSRTVTTDSKWLAFILEQLLSNAVKYTKRGGIKIYLENGTLVVEDTGIGIRAEDLPRIFEKGYTGYNGRLSQRASGIGLYMAKRAADQLSLGIKVTSRPGVGTKAAVTFPDRMSMPE